MLHPSSPPGVPVTDDAGHTVNPPIPTDAYGHPIPQVCILTRLY